MTISSRSTSSSSFASARTNPSPPPSPASARTNCSGENTSVPPTMTSRPSDRDSACASRVSPRVTPPTTKTMRRRPTGAETTLLPVCVRAAARAAPPPPPPRRNRARHPPPPNGAPTLPRRAPFERIYPGFSGARSTRRVRSRVRDSSARGGGHGGGERIAGGGASGERIAPPPSPSISGNRRERACRRRRDSRALTVGTNLLRSHSLFREARWVVSPLWFETSRRRRLLRFLDLRAESFEVRRWRDLRVSPVSFAHRARSASSNFSGWLAAYSSNSLSLSAGVMSSSRALNALSNATMSLPSPRRRRRSPPRDQPRSARGRSGWR